MKQSTVNPQQSIVGETAAFDTTSLSPQNTEGKGFFVYLTLGNSSNDPFQAYLAVAEMPVDRPRTSRNYCSPDRFRLWTEQYDLARGRR